MCGVVGWGIDFMFVFEFRGIRGFTLFRGLCGVYMEMCLLLSWCVMVESLGVNVGDGMVVIVKDFWFFRWKSEFYD
ncbi:hypothetical protein [Candidatus Gillettellia adelgis]